MARPSRTLIAPARRCAFAVLRRVFEQGAYADRALQSEAAGLDARDRALATRLAYGSVQRKATLDHLIEQLAERPAARLDAHLLAALRLGLYELLYLEGAPDYAVVADAVELAKGQRRGGHGLVNAVLRRAIREGGEELLGGLDDETPERAALKHSHPPWIARMWWDYLGPDQARALMAYDNEPGELALRANSLLTDAHALSERLHADGVRTHRDEALAEAVVLDGPYDVHGSELWRSGACIAQSRAAMCVSRALEPCADERVLDLCAAPGGKTTHISALMQARGEVLAVDRNPRRAAELGATARRMHAGNVRVEIADAALDGSHRGTFDRVLVDPPCSGLGTLQARADLRWRATPEALDALADTQRAILAAGAQSLRPGGVLVYSTCTISATENEHVIATFLDSHDDFHLDDLAAQHAIVGQAPPGPPERSGAAAGALLTLPHRDRTAGFFIARLRRS